MKNPALYAEFHRGKSGCLGSWLVGSLKSEAEEGNSGEDGIDSEQHRQHERCVVGPFGKDQASEDQCGNPVKDDQWPRTIAAEFERRNDGNEAFGQKQYCQRKRKGKRCRDRIGKDIDTHDDTEKCRGQHEETMWDCPRKNRTDEAGNPGNEHKNSDDLDKCRSADAGIRNRKESGEDAEDTAGDQPAAAGEIGVG